MAGLSPQDYKTIEIGPLSGLLDTRSQPHEIPLGGWRWVENVTVQSRDKPCRRPGFGRLFGELTPYNNQDLHDQLTMSDNQPVTLLFEAVATTGPHQLIAGTQNRLYALNNSTGNWTTISDQGFGGTPLTACSDTIWRAAQSEDIVIFTNGLDKPQYWPFDGAPGLSEITDLNAIGITKADVVATWKGLVFLCNVVADGVRIPSRLVWSDFKKPLSFIPNANVSVAGFHDLGYGEDILAVMPLSDSLIIYTTHGIWECQVTGSADILSFRQRYAEPLTGNSCLAYKRTLISTGNEHLYMGRDAIYAFNLYVTRPQRIEWIYQASGTMFLELETSLCGLHVAGYNPKTREAWFSYAKTSDTARCPSKTLILNTEYPFADYMNRGFTAFTNYSPTTFSSLRSFLLEKCICTSGDLVTLDDGSGYCVAPPPITCASPVTSIFSVTPYNYYGISTENFAGAPDAGSLCTLLGDLTLEQLCSEENQTAACSAAQRFVMASSDDHALKQYDFGFYAHELVTAHTVCGTYQSIGYDTIFRSSSLGFNAPNAEKLVRRFLVNLTADLQTIPTNLNVRLGFARDPSDPNLTICPIMWHVLPPKPLVCSSNLTEAQHIAARTRPYLAHQWATFWGGCQFYFELKVSGTGGASCFSSINLDISAKPIRT